MGGVQRLYTSHLYVKSAIFDDFSLKARSVNFAPASVYHPRLLFVNIAIHAHMYT